jgi:hypothetical protein
MKDKPPWIYVGLALFAPEADNKLAQNLILSKQRTGCGTMVSNPILKFEITKLQILWH